MKWIARNSVLLLAVAFVLAVSTQSTSARAMGVQDGHGETPAENHETGTPGEQPAGGEEEHADDGHGAPAQAIRSVNEGLVAGITTIIVFLIVLIVLARVVWPKLVAGLDERAEKIRAEIAAAERAREDAKQSLVEYEKSLAEARAESKKILDETKAYQQTLAADLKSKADAELAKLKDRARRDIDAAKKTAISEIYADATSLATIMASKILHRQVNDQDSSRLMEESLRELPNVNN